MEMKSSLAEQLRAEFPIFHQPGGPLIYLDFASTGQVPEVVLDAMDEYYRSYKSNIHRGVYKISEQATEAYEQSRAEVARWIGAQEQEIVFTSGTTDSINRIAMMLAPKIQSGDEIWLNIMEHHSNLLPWQRLAKQTGAVLRWIEIRDGQLNLEHFERNANERTRVVAVSQMSNVTGAIAPVEQLGRICHEHGAMLVVDAAQSIAHLPLDVRIMDCDFLAFSGHKMYGPMGVGVMMGKAALLAELEPSIQGGGMIRRVEKDHAKWADLPWKFEAGTPNIAGVIGLGAAIRFLKKVQMAKLHTEEAALTQAAIKMFRELPSLTLFTSTPETQGPLFSFAHEQIHPHDLATLLDGHGIAVRAGHHCAQLFMTHLNVAATTRVSFGMTTTLSDIEQTVAAVQKAIRRFTSS